MADNQTADPVKDNPQPEAEGQEGSILTSKAQATEPEGVKPERPAWMAQLPKELQAHESLTKFKAIGDVGKSYIELEGKLGKAIVPPAEDAPEAEWRAYWQKLGAPESPEKYTLDANVPKELYSDEMVNSFKQWAFDQGLSVKQAQGIFAKYSEFAQSAVKEKAKADELQKETVLKNLREEWGPSFKENLSYMERAFLKFGTKDVEKVLIKTGAGNNPSVIKMFVEIGKQLREGPMLSSNSSDVEKKPIAEILYPSK